jgi:hypothetical protein
MRLQSTKGSVGSVPKLEERYFVSVALSSSEGEILSFVGKVAK